jgi:hypothetical protein
MRFCESPDGINSIGVLHHREHERDEPNLPSAVEDIRSYNAAHGDLSALPGHVTVTPDGRHTLISANSQ